MKKQVFIIAFATLGLSSCGLYRNYDRPSDIQTDGLYGTAQTGNTEQSLGAKAWREFFTDPQLQALIERGLAQNLNMRQLDLQMVQAAEVLYGASLSLMADW